MVVFLFLSFSFSFFFPFLIITQSECSSVHARGARMHPRPNSAVESEGRLRFLKAAPAVESEGRLRFPKAAPAAKSTEFFCITVRGGSAISYRCLAFRSSLRALNHGIHLRCLLAP